MRISRLSSSNQELSEVFKAICETAASALSVERAGIWLFVNHRTAIRCVCLLERSTGQFSEGTTLSVANFPNYFAGLRVRKTLSAENAAYDPGTNELLETYLAPLGITSMLDAPILLDGDMIGVICHEQVGPPREWTTEERDFAGSVADLTALKIRGSELGKLRQIVQDLDSDRAALRQRESLETLAAGAAHDFRNVLLIIRGYAENIAALPEASSEIKELVAGIQRTVERGKALSDELMELGHERTGRPRVLNLAEHMHQFLPALKSILGKGHRLEFRCETANDRVFVEPSQLERIVMNLVVNARDAMKKGGAITVSLSSGQDESSGQVILAVSDTGEGIDPAIRDRIFDPFFTTKPRADGAGLGLSVVRGAVHHAGGSLRVESEPGHGTTFFVKLPRVSAS